MDNLYFYYLDFLQQYSIPDFIITVSWYLIPFCMIAALLILVVLILVLLERKVLAFFTLRKGPNRVGFEGMLQTVADAIKLLFKENITPANCNKFLFFIAPIIAKFVCRYSFIFCDSGITRIGYYFCRIRQQKQLFLIRRNESYCANFEL